MKKNLIRLFSFLLVILILFGSLNLAMEDENHRWSMFYRLPKNSIDVVFMGNSHNFSTFQPQIIDNIIPVNSYVVGVPGENTFVTYYELKELLRYQHPKVVVLESFATNVTGSEDMGYIYEFLDPGRFDINRYMVAKEFLGLENAFSIFPALRTRIYWNPLSHYTSNFVYHAFEEKNFAITKDMGANPKENIISQTDYSGGLKESWINSISTSAENLAYLQKIYDLCKAEGIQLIITSVPVISQVPELTSEIDKFTSENNIPYFTYEQSQFNHLHFANTTHVSIFGSVIISVEIAQKLANYLNLPIDETSLHYYQTFFYSDYKITNQGNDYQIQLQQTEPNLITEYTWNIQDTSTGEVILEESVNQSSVNFKLSKPGKYRIAVTIKNPEGDYQVNAWFVVTKET